MGGGGGSSGRVEFPTYMEDTHQDWLGYTSTGVDDTVDVDLIAVMDNALGMGGNPWEGHTLTDPATDLAAVQTRYSTYETLVDALDEETDWDSMIDNAVAKVDEAGVLVDVDFSTVVASARSGATTSLAAGIAAALDELDDAVIARAVQAYMNRGSVQKERAIGRFSSTMADMNAVNSSAFMFGLAIIEAQHMQDVDQYQAQIELQAYNNLVNNWVAMFRAELEQELRMEVTNKSSRETVLREGAQMMVQMLSNRVQSTANTAALLAETKRVGIVATQEYELADADLDYKFSQWDFEVFTRAANVLGSISGAAAYVPGQPSKTASAIGGALSGAAAGAGIGTAIAPGIGTAVGAAVGGIAGLLSGIF